MKKIIYWTSAILLGAVIGYFSAPFFKNKSLHLNFKRQTSILFDSLELNLGTLNSNQSKKVKFKFLNRGKYPLVIYNVKATCGCSSPEWPKTTIKPNESGYITVLYEATSSGFFNKKLIVYGNFIENPITLTIFGNVIDQ